MANTKLQASDNLEGWQDFQKEALIYITSDITSDAG